MPDSQPANIPVNTSDSAMTTPQTTLPGTALPQGDMGSANVEEIYKIPRPMSKFGEKISIYHKAHKFMTFGLAPRGISITNAFPPQENPVWMITSLAEVPVHMPALYLTQSEYNLLPQGSHVLEVHCDVYYRGTVVQFETAGTSTQLATLNQINDIYVSNALNKTGQGSNINITEFEETQHMVPKTIQLPVYGPAPPYIGLIADYYGENSDNTNFSEHVPHHHMGRQTFLRNYWALTARGPATDPLLMVRGGWPPLTDKIDQYDGRTVINKCVLKYSYKPKIAPLTHPLRTFNHGLPFWRQIGVGLNVPVGGNLPNNRRMVGSMAPSTSTGTHIHLDEIDEPLNNDTNNLNYNIYTPIEKSQFMRSGMWGEQIPHIQPSVHIGIQPIPSLSTPSSSTPQTGFGTWTNTRAYWDVHCTIVIKEHRPTEYPYATEANVPMGDQLLTAQVDTWPANSKNARHDGATMAGLYTQHWTSPQDTSTPPNGFTDSQLVKIKEDAKKLTEKKNKDKNNISKGTKFN